MSISSLLPSLRPELEAAYVEMDGTGQINAFAICRTWDDTAWEVITKNDNVYCALSGGYPTRDAAVFAGSAWLHRTPGTGQT